MFDGNPSVPTPPPPPTPFGPPAAGPPRPAVPPSGGMVYASSPKRPWIWIAVIVVAAVVVIALLAITGVFVKPGSAAVGSGTPVPFTYAIGVVSASGASEAGGPWSVVAAEGVGIPNGISEPNWEFVGSSGCSFSPVPGGSSQVTILGTSSTAAPGEVATWMFFEKNSSANVILLSAVSNGQLNPLILVTGCSTVGTFAALSAVTANNVVDSTTVAMSFDENGGSSFLASHPGATETFILVGGTAGSGGAWDIEYSTCALTTSPAGAGSWLSGVYIASDGSVLTSPTSGSGAC